MVLIIGDHEVKEVPSSTAAIYSNFPFLKEASNNLTNIRTQEMSPRGLLYLRQREYAITVPHDENVQFLGTDDATTSVMAVIRHTVLGTVGLAHFDKCSHEGCLRGVHICSHDDGVVNLLAKVIELSSMVFNESQGRLELFVVGGFRDSRNICEKITISLLNAFHRYERQIYLSLLCTGDLNTTVRGNISFPLIKGIGVSIQNGNIFPATFSEKGPYLIWRSTRVFTGDQKMANIYDCQHGILKIGPFNYEPHAGVELLLEQTDEVILQYLSASPEVEGPSWVKLVRDVLKHIKEHPFPGVTIFPDNNPHIFRRDSSGNWVLVKYPNNNDLIPDANLQAGLHHPGTWPTGTVTTTSTASPPTPIAPQHSPWGTSVPPRYGSLQIDCRLKTAHLGVTVPPMMNTQHYDDHLLNPAKDRFIPTWQASQL